jgi:hypothetical protein
MVEKRVTGIDVMPFAASLTATNLAVQNVPVTLASARVGMTDSLGLEGGSPIPAFSVALQEMLRDLGLGSSKKRVRNTRRVAVGLKGRPEPFKIERPDYLLMNPPFSDWEKIPDDIRKTVTARASMVARAGGTENLWKLFVIQTWDLGKDRTVYGCVIPVNLFKGSATEKVRQHLYTHSTIETIIIGEKELAFSESSDYRDLLIVYRKEPPAEGHRIKVVHLHRSLAELGIEGSASLGDALGDAIYSGKSAPEDCWIEDVPQPTTTLKDDLVLRVFGSGTPERKHLEQSLKHIAERGKSKLRPLTSKEIWEGFGPRPKGLSDIVLVRRETPGMKPPTHRTHQTTLVLERATRSRLFFYRKAPGGKKAFHLSVSIGRSEDEPNGALPALTTIAGIRTLDLNDDTDFVLVAPYTGWKKLRALSGWSKRKDLDQMFSWKELVVDQVRSKKTRLAVPDKLQIDSPDAFTLSTYRTRPFVVTNMLYGIDVSDEKEAAYQALWLNSVATLSFFVLRQGGALAGGLTRLKLSDWTQHRLLDIKQLSEDDKKALDSVLSKLARKPLKSIVDQLKADSDRKAIDTAILGVLGFNAEEIEKMLPAIYSGLLSDMARPSARIAGTEERKEEGVQSTLEV